MAEARPSTILIVDDDKAQAYAMARVLVRAGFQVLHVHTGREALLAVKRCPDLLVLDIDLPDVNGRDICRSVKADPTTARIAVLHVSATQTGSAAQAEALEQGADAYLVQPVDPHVLIATVRALLRMKRAEEEAHASEQRYRAMGEELEAALARLRFHLENSPVIITEWDNDFVLKYWSPQAERAFGWTAEEVVGKTPWQFGFIPAEEHDAVAEVNRRLNDGRDPYNISYNRNYDKQGNVHYCEWYNSSLLDAAGRLVSIFAITLDVTEREQMQQELRRNEEHLRLAYQAGNMWSWQMERDGEISWSREAAMEEGPRYPWLRQSLDNWLERVHPDDRAHVRTALHQSFATQSKYEADFRLCFADGTYHWVMGRGNVVPGSGGLKMFGIAMDITEHQRAEEALALSEARLRLAQQAGTVGTWEWDVAGGTLVWSDELWAICGLAPNAFLLTFDAAFQVIHPDDRDAMRRTFGEVGVLRDELNLEARVVWPDDSVRWVECRGKLYRDESGKPARMVGITIDITQRKQSEEMLRLNEKLAASGRLAASLAHEINNPLAAVTNLLFLLGQDKTLSSVAQQYTSMAQSELARVAGITKNILGLYRESPRPVAVSLSAILDDVLQLYAHKTRRTQTKIRKRFEDAGVISGFPGELRQLFSNLVVNALEALGDDGLLVLHVTRNAAGVRVTVADSGPGIDQQHRRKIFEPFFTTKGEMGTGLGLWVASGIVSKHGGTMRVRSNTQPGRSGTVFSIVFPEGVFSEAQPQAAKASA